MSYEQIHNFINKKTIIKLIVLLVFSTQLIGLPECKLGIENIPAWLVTEYTKPKPLRIGLITNQTGRDQKGNRTVDILVKKGFTITYLFAPEHGFSGTIEAAKEVKDGYDVKTKIPIMSLYSHESGKKISPEILNTIDALFFDIQDSGMRHYTYISTLFSVLKAAGLEQKKVVVFDRPNPLGKAMEGPLVEPELISFISIAPIPLRHGMTVGELAEYFNRYLLDTKADLHIVPMKDYCRESISCLIAPLSPNIASKESCLGYSFLGLLGEVKPFDVGVGTPHAFQLIALPESLAVSVAVWQQLAKELNILGISTNGCRYLHDRKKEYYHGLRLKIDNISNLAAFKAFLATVQLIKKAGVSLDFAVNFDKAVGSKLVRFFFMGLIKDQELMQEIKNGLQLFFQKAQTVFKYLPHPELVFN